MEVQTVKGKIDFINFLKNKRNIRSLIYKKIKNETIRQILECGRLVLSTQTPIRICVVIHPTVKLMLSELTEEDKDIINEAYVNFVVFLNIERSSNRLRDIQNIGAVMHSIQLCTQNLGLGAVFIDTLLNNQEQVQKIFKFSLETYELKGIICIGEIGEIEPETKNPQEIDKFTEWY